MKDAERKIPIQNVYRLLLYAWNLVGEREAVNVGEEGYAELHDLFAHVLAQTVETLVTRGLDRGYVPRDDSVQGVRGKLDIGATIRLPPAGPPRAGPLGGPRADLARHPAEPVGPAGRVATPVTPPAG